MKRFRQGRPGAGRGGAARQRLRTRALFFPRMSFSFSPPSNTCASGKAVTLESLCSYKQSQPPTGTRASPHRTTPVLSLHVTTQTV